MPQRLSVNINDEAAQILRQAKENGLSTTEAVRRAIGLLGFFEDTKRNGLKLYAEDSRGQRSTVNVI